MSLPRSKVNASRVIGAVLAILSGYPAQAREELATLPVPSNTVRFGVAVAISSDYAVVGDNGISWQGVPWAGTAYIYLRDDNATPKDLKDDSWAEVQQIGPSDPRFEGVFGSALSLDGDRLLVGAPNDEPAAARLGSAYVFRRDPEGWVEEAVLRPSIGASSSNTFGYSVSIRGNLAVVGAPWIDRAFVFRREGTAWVEEAALIGSDTANGDAFGTSVSIDGDRIAVGVPYHAAFSGAAYVFRDNAGTWPEEAKLTRPPTAGFGRSVSLHVDDLAIGSGSSVSGVSGLVYIFTRSGSSWLEQDILSAANARSFGISVALDGDALVVGSYDPEAFLFRRYGTSWFEDDRLLRSDGTQGPSWPVDAGESMALVVHHYVYSTAQDDTLPIPTLSVWGLLVILMLLLSAGTVILRRVAPRGRAFSALKSALILWGFLFMETHGATAQAPNLNARRHPEQLIVRFKAGVSEESRQQTHAVMGTSELTAFRYVDGLVVVSVARERLLIALGAYLAHPAVLYAEPDYFGELTVLPNDPSFNLQWGLHNTGQTLDNPEAPPPDPGTPGADIDAPEAWDIATGTYSIHVGIVDTGIAYNHPDIAGNMVADLGYDFAGDGAGGPDPDPMDDSAKAGHGTHVAGIVGAMGNNGIGVVGVNWQCRLVALKILESSSDAVLASRAMQAMQYIIDHDIKISNHSYSFDAYSQGLYDNIQASQAIGHILVAAADNAGTDNDVIPRYPCSYNLSNTICVAMMDNDDNLDPGSCYGLTSVDLGAPGINVYSTWYIRQPPTYTYKFKSGTSMASPHVTGVIALLWSKYPNMPWTLVRDKVLATVRPVASLNGKTVTGGVVNASAALACAPSLVCCVGLEGECLVTTECECAHLGGTFKGSQSACQWNSCPPAYGPGGSGP